MAANEEKEHTKFIGKKDIDVPGLEPTHVGYFRRLAKRDGTEPARAQYEGMSREKAEYLAGLDDSMDMYGVKWTVDALRKRFAEKRFSRYVEPKPRPEYDYDDYYDRDEFYGPKDTVTYARWLYNRYGAGKVAKQFHISADLAEMIGESSIPGSTKVAGLEEDDIEEFEDCRYERQAARYENVRNVHEFRDDNSRKIKIRLNKLADNDTAFVIRKLIETEEFNIKAKECPFKYSDYNYAKKSENLVAALNRLKEMDWKYWWADDTEGQANYIVYVVLPNGKHAAQAGRLPQGSLPVNIRREVRQEEMHGRT